MDDDLRGVAHRRSKQRPDDNADHARKRLASRCREGRLQGANTRFRPWRSDPRPHRPGRQRRLLRPWLSPWRSLGERLCAAGLDRADAGQQPYGSCSTPKSPVRSRGSVTTGRCSVCGRATPLASGSFRQRPRRRSTPRRWSGRTWVFLDVRCEKTLPGGLRRSTPVATASLRLIRIE